MKSKYNRSCKINLRFATNLKKKIIKNLLNEYRRVVNLYIKKLWINKGRLDKETLALIQNTSLSERYKSQALKQALEIVVSTKKALKATKRLSNKIPTFNGPAKLDAKFISIEEPKHLKDFDLAIRLSTLSKGNRIIIPAKRTKVFNKWNDHPNSKLIQGCLLSEEGVTLFFEIEEELKEEGKEIGIDLGKTKIITTSEKEFLGLDFEKINQKLKRKKNGSKSKKRAYKERDNYFGKIVNSLKFEEFKTIVIEDLINLKKGKNPNRSKSFRKSLRHWTYPEVISKIENKSQENRICLVKVDPQNTSRTCPSCKFVAKENRNGEKFKCQSCGFSEDADYVGALNILSKYLFS
jgi:IS605 OrfB family transposase